MAGPKRQSEKKRSTAEKHVSLSVLQQYFCGSLKDAAKSIGGETSSSFSYQSLLSLPILETMLIAFIRTV